MFSLKRYGKVENFTVRMPCLLCDAGDQVSAEEQIRPEAAASAGAGGNLHAHWRWLPHTFHLSGGSNLWPQADILHWQQ